MGFTRHGSCFGNSKNQLITGVFIRTNCSTWHFWEQGFVTNNNSHLCLHILIWYSPCHVIYRWFCILLYLWVYHHFLVNPCNVFNHNHHSCFTGTGLTATLSRSPLCNPEYRFNQPSPNIVIQLIWKFQESNWNPDWFIALMDSSGTNYIFTNNKNLGQYDQNSIPSQIMTCYSYPGNLIHQNGIPIELTCQQAHLGLIMSLMSMKMLANMVHMWYSEVMPCYRYPSSLLDQFEILIDSSC